MAAAPEFVEVPPPVAWLYLNFWFTIPSSQKELLCPADCLVAVTLETSGQYVYELLSSMTPLTDWYSWNSMGVVVYLFDPSQKH